MECVETAHFYTSKDIDNVIQDTETTVTNDLEGGDRQRAMKRLRVPPLGEHQSPWTTFKVGLFSGSFIILFVAVVLSGTMNERVWKTRRGRRNEETVSVISIVLFQRYFTTAVKTSRLHLDYTADLCSLYNFYFSSA